MWPRLQRSLLVGLILAGAVALRLSPLLWSPLPFNPDGILYAADADATLAATHLPLARLPTDNLHFTVFLAEVPAVTGQPALTIVQPTTAPPRFHRVALFAPRRQPNSRRVLPDIGG